MGRGLTLEEGLRLFDDPACGVVAAQGADRDRKRVAQLAPLGPHDLPRRVHPLGGEGSTGGARVNAQRHRVAVPPLVPDRERVARRARSPDHPAEAVEARPLDQPVGVDDREGRAELRVEVRFDGVTERVLGRGGERRPGVRVVELRDALVPIEVALDGGLEVPVRVEEDVALEDLGAAIFVRARRREVVGLADRGLEPAVERVVLHPDRDVGLAVVALDPRAVRAHASDDPGCREVAGADRGLGLVLTLRVLARGVAIDVDGGGGAEGKIALRPRDVVAVGVGRGARVHRGQPGEGFVRVGVEREVADVFVVADVLLRDDGRPALVVRVQVVVDEELGPEGPRRVPRVLEVAPLDQVRDVHRASRGVVGVRRRIEAPIESIRRDSARRKVGDRHFPEAEPATSVERGSTIPVSIAGLRRQLPTVRHDTGDDTSSVDVATDAVGVTSLTRRVGRVDVRVGHRRVGDHRAFAETVAELGDALRLALVVEDDLEAGREAVFRGIAVADVRREDVWNAITVGIQHARDRTSFDLSVVTRQRANAKSL